MRNDERGTEGKSSFSSSLIVPHSSFFEVAGAKMSAQETEPKNLSRELRVINNPPSARPPRGPKPEWLRIRIGDPTNQNAVLKLIEGLNLHTVCQEARCPNIFECWTDRTATFMIGGDICTRHCGFCAVSKGAAPPLDSEEPRHVAEAVRHLNLAHTVITSVNRDDLADGGAAHWAETIRQVRALNPGCRIEVLIPDFNGDESALDAVLDAEPDVLNHNTRSTSSP
jgi:lipoic acid synthetase